MRLKNPANSDILVVMRKRAAHFGQKSDSPSLKNAYGVFKP
jgi:hypothetical protein